MSAVVTLDPATWIIGLLTTLCVSMFIFILTQWGRIKDLKQDHGALRTEKEQLVQQITDAQKEHFIALEDNKAKHDSEINRKEEKIVELHKENVWLKDELENKKENGDMSGFASG